MHEYVQVQLRTKGKFGFGHHADCIAVGKEPLPPFLNGMFRVKSAI